MFTRSSSNAEPSHVLHRPSSARAQDVSHILSKKFGELFMRDPVDSQTIHNLRTSQGSDDPYHQKYVEELLKISDIRQRRLDACTRLERSIMQARAQAMSADERQLNRVMEQTQRAASAAATTLQELPAMNSHFRACVDNNLLHDNGLLCPRDLSQEEAPPVPLPRAQEPTHLRSTSASASRSIRTGGADTGSARDDVLSDYGLEDDLMTCESASNGMPIDGDEEMSAEIRGGKPSSAHSLRTRKLKEISKGKNRSWKENMNAMDREYDRQWLDQLQVKNNYRRNPRFLLPYEEGGAGRLVDSQIPSKHCEDVDIFISNPKKIHFSEYEVGQVYELPLELKNVTSVIRTVRTIPPKTKYFSISLGQFPGENGLVAPGMSCKYIIRFSPDSLRDFEDEIVIESQRKTPLVIKILSRRPRPILTIPQTVQAGECLIFGTKIIDYQIKNCGGKGKFLLLPKSGWPSTNFKASLPSDQALVIPPFQIQPAYFELDRGKLMNLKLYFAPSDLKVYEEEFYILCDNCQIKKIKMRGTAELAGLEMTNVEGGVAEPVPGELCDVSAEHLIRFDHLHPYTYSQKTLWIRNKTHVELPYTWKVVKPCSRPAGEIDKNDSPPRNRTLDIDAPFAVEPQMGSFKPQETIAFQLTFAPTDVGQFHSALHLVLQNIPDLVPAPLAPSEGSTFITQEERMGGMENPRQGLNPEVQSTDVTGLEVEVKGLSEPLNVTVDPQAVCIPGQLLVHTTMRKQVRMCNRSQCPVTFMWEACSETHILEVEPRMGVIDPGQSGLVDLCITGTTPGKISHALSCQVDNLEEPIHLLVEADIKGPSIAIDQPDLNFGLVRLGEHCLRGLWLRNTAQINCDWEVRIPDDMQSEFSVTPSRGQLRPLEELQIKAEYRPTAVRQLDTELEVQVPNGERTALHVLAECQRPIFCLRDCKLQLDELYKDVEVTHVVHLLNRTLLPSQFQWGAAEGADKVHVSVQIDPAEGMLAGREEMGISVKIRVDDVMELTDLWVPCIVDGMEDPVVLMISGQVHGLRVSFTIPPEEETSASDQLMIDFGDQVALGAVTKRKLHIINHTAIPTTFNLQLAHFPATPPSSVAASVGPTVTDRGVLLKKTPNLADPRSKPPKYAHYDFCKAMLGKRQGAAFHCEPSSGELGGFAERVIEVVAYNDMWGLYSDSLLCDISGRVTPVPIRLGVVGCPVEFTMTTAQPSQKPIVRFGTRTSGTEPVTRQIRLNNKSPFAIRLDWDMFNISEGDEKLLDLCINFGRVFPPLDAVGEELLPSLEDSPRPSTRCPTGYLPDTPDTSSLGLPSRVTTGFDVHPETGYTPASLEPEERLKVASLVLRPHDGCPANSPFSVRPSQLTIPAESYEYIFVTFTPTIDVALLEARQGSVECAGYSLGFLSVDEVRGEIEAHVHREQAFAVDQLRLDMTGRIDAPELEVDYQDDDDGFSFRTVFSERLMSPANSSSPDVIPAVVNSTSALLRNTKETSLSFTLNIAPPFILLKPDASASVDARGNPVIVLGPRQTIMIAVGFTVHQELLSRMLELRGRSQEESPGAFVELDGEEAVLKYRDALTIRFNNNMEQLLPLTASVIFPAFVLTRDALDFSMCFVGQTREQQVQICNPTRAQCVWRARIAESTAEDPSVLRVEPSHGLLEGAVSHIAKNKTLLRVFFTPKHSEAFRATVVFEGIFGETGRELVITGHGSYDGQYEEMYNV